MIDRKAKQNGKGYKEEECYTLNSTDRHGVVYEAYQHHGWKQGSTCNTLTTGQNNTVRGDTPLVCEEKTTYQETTGTLTPGAHAGSYNGQDAYNDMLVTYAKQRIDEYK